MVCPTSKLLITFHLEVIACLTSSLNLLGGEFCFNVEATAAPENTWALQGDEHTILSPCTNYQK
jgi:hypothetical protein